MDAGDIGLAILAGLGILACAAAVAFLAQGIARWLRRRGR